MDSISLTFFFPPHSLSPFQYYPYGGTKVVFTDDEMKSLKEVADPGLVLMGFKPYDALKPSMNFRGSYFIYPDDEQFTESSKAFKALLFGMAELKQMAICRLIYRKGSIPRFVALMPQLPKIDPEVIGQTKKERRKGESRIQISSLIYIAVFTFSSSFFLSTLWLFLSSA